MKTFIISSILLLFTIISIISITPSAFAANTVTITTVDGSGFSQECIETGCYNPSTATVDVGGKVIFSNTDASPHTFTAGTVDGFTPSPSSEFDSSVIMQDESYEWTPETVGEVPYYCTLHTWMIGTIIVQEAVSEEETPKEEMMMEMETMMVGTVDITMSSPIEGSDDATVTIIEFGDYQCPKCDQWFQNEKPTIATDYIDNGKAKLYFVDFPFLGEDSTTAANASYCANDQEKFWEYHSMLYNNQGGINEGWANIDALKQFAADVGLDTAEFNACVDSNKHADRVSYNKQVGTSHGVEGTPVFIIVGPDGSMERIDGPQSSDIFADVIHGMLGEPMKEAMAETNSPIETINIGSSALYVELINDKAYVSNPEDGSISIIDTNSNQVVDTIDVPKGVLIIEKVLDKNKIYATMDDQNKVFVFDLETNEKLKEIDLGEPETTLFSKSDKSYGQREYTTFQTNGIGLEYNPNNEMLYAAHSQVNHVNVIDTNQDMVVDTIPVGKTPLLIEIDEITNTAFVTNWETNDVTVIDTETNEVIGDLNTGFVPDQMAIDPENRRLYVTHHASPHVSVIDLRDNTIEGEIKLKGPTHALAVDTKNDLLHVTYTPDSAFTGTSTINQVEFIDTKTNKIVGSFELEDNPFVIKIDSENQKLYATIIKQGALVTVDLATDEEYQKIVSLQSETSNTDESSGTNAEGGGCLIATAAYGTELAPQVQFLREIRDNTVMSTDSGSAFMTGFNQLYYSFSPTIANMERENPFFQEAVRVFITPMISTLSIMTLAENGSESDVLAAGISVLALNLGMYIAAPVTAGFAVSKHLKSRK